MRNIDPYGSLAAFLRSDTMRELTASSGRPLRVLDLGCGDGRAAIDLARLGHAVTAVERSPAALASARRTAARLRAPIRLLEADARDLAFLEEGSFDLVVDNHVYHFIIGVLDRQSFLAGAYRVLRAGGILFSETMVAEGGFDPESLRVDPVTRLDASRERFWALTGELVAELTSAGFAIEHTGRRAPGAPAGDLVVSWSRKPL